jgi:hypothetical protein
MTNERTIDVLLTVRAYYASLTAGYPKGKDRKGIGDVMCSEIANACLMASKALEQQRWIPVSERLPEDYIHVLCQFTLGGMGECYLAHGVFHVVGGLVMTCNEVIAWQPLPQRYEVESEG